MRNTFGIFSPFQLDENVDFPKKDELGGIVLKFIGGGATYLKMQTEMPSKDEVEDIHNVGRFLRETFGQYVLVNVLCTPDIEIHDINVDDFVDVHTDFVSLRKSRGDLVLEILTNKLERGMEFTEQDHYWRLLLPYMGRKDENKFKERYSQFLELFDKANLEVPSECHLNTYNVWQRMYDRK